MIDQYHFYHGAALREICANSIKPVAIEYINKKLDQDSHNFNTYIVNNKVGVYIKHSTSRAKTWSFSFVKEQQVTLIFTERPTSGAHKLPGVVLVPGYAVFRLCYKSLVWPLRWVLLAFCSDPPMFRPSHSRYIGALFLLTVRTTTW